MPGLTFRGAVSRFFRIYGRDTCDENRPIKSALKEPDSAAINGMIKLFDKYSIIAEKKKIYEDAKEEESVFKKAKNMSLFYLYTTKKALKKIIKE